MRHQAIPSQYTAFREPRRPAKSCANIRIEILRRYQVLSRNRKSPHVTHETASLAKYSPLCLAKLLESLFLSTMKRM